MPTLRTVLLFSLCLLALRSNAQDTERVAAVQCAASGRYDLAPEINIEKDLENFRRLALPLSARNVSLVVFPEAVFWGYALSAANASDARKRMAAYAEEMPALGVVECDAGEGSPPLRPILQGLSCLAREASLAVVADVVSEVLCTAGACKQEGERKKKVDVA
jgi:predicted amidohydrolase